MAYRPSSRANVGIIKLPDEMSDEQAILLSDIFPTGYFGADLADIAPGRTIAVFGCGPVGPFVIASARLKDAGRIFAIDCIPSRLEMARDQGAEIIDFSKEDPVEAIKGFTGGIGLDRTVDVVGVDAVRGKGSHDDKKASQEVRKVAPITGERGDNWHPSDSPSQALQWQLKAVAKAGRLSIIGVYPEALDSFPIGATINKAPQRQDGELQPQKIHSNSREPGARGGGGPNRSPDQARAANLRPRGVQGVRPPGGGMGEGRVEAGDRRVGPDLGFQKPRPLAVAFFFAERLLLRRVCHVEARFAAFRLDTDDQPALVAAGDHGVLVALGGGDGSGILFAVEVSYLLGAGRRFRTLRRQRSCSRS